MTTTSPDTSAPPVDPRLRRRRAEVQRRKGRRRLRRLLVVTAVGTVGLAAWGLSLSPLLDVDRVLIRGTEGERMAPVRTAAGIDQGEAMATVDLDAAGRAVEAVPWVDGATVRRSWPGTVVVAVTERQPVAALRTADGSWALVDGDRRQVEVVPGTVDHGLPRIEGLEPSAEPGEVLGQAASGAVELSQRLVEVLPRFGTSARLVAVDIAVDGSLSAGIDLPGAQDVQAHFGRPGELVDKVASMVAVIEGSGTVPTGAVIDLRVPDSPALTVPQH